jgi:hypothetical protein
MLDVNLKPDRLASSEELLQILEECHENGLLTVPRLLTDNKARSFVASLESGVGTVYRDDISEEVRTKIGPKRE